MIIGICSANQVKRRAITRACTNVLRVKIDFLDINYISKIRQPIGINEINSEMNQRILSAKRKQPNCDLYIASEGGIVWVNRRPYLQTWSMVVDKAGKKFLSAGPMIPIKEFVKGLKISNQVSFASILDNHPSLNAGTGGSSGRLTDKLINREEDVYLSLVPALVEAIR